jgi:hypothetical protein
VSEEPAGSAIEDERRAGHPVLQGTSGPTETMPCPLITATNMEEASNPFDFAIQAAANSSRPKETKTEIVV